MINIIVPIGIALIINMLLPDYKEFYESLNKIDIPMFVFPIVWSVIYVLIGISNYLIYKETGNKAEQIYIFQLFLNFMWTPIFFGLRNILLTLIWTIFLLVFVFINLVKYYKIKKETGYLFIPYFLWTIFALFLISYIYIHN